MFNNLQNIVATVLDVLGVIGRVTEVVQVVLDISSGGLPYQSSSSQESGRSHLRQQAEGMTVKFDDGELRELQPKQPLRSGHPQPPRWHPRWHPRRPSPGHHLGREEGLRFRGQIPRVTVELL